MGLTEVTPNSSPEIDMVLEFVGLKPGNPYCAASVSYWIGVSGVNYPTVRSGLARHFILPNSIPAFKILTGIEVAYPGDIAVWQRGNSIYGHTGVIDEWDQADGYILEGNTSSGNQGSQFDGEGFYRRHRTIVPGAAFRITYVTRVEY